MPADAGNIHCRSGSEKCPSTVTEKRMLLSFSASEAFMAKFEKIKSLAWHRLPANPSLEQLFEFVMEFYIDKKDPTPRRDRREARGEVWSEELKVRTGEPLARTGSRERYVAASVKDQVFTRDKSRCTYVGATGRRCTSTNALQLDHIEPIARGGKSTTGNLRLLCAYHNRLEAERVLGCRAARVTTDSTPTRTVPGSSRGRPFRAPT